MPEADQPLLIKRYASRRLYNTETSDYVTLEDVARLIRDGREVRIVDLKTGDDLTRQYLLQIVAEHESRGESVLPVNVLTDLVRSYTTGMQKIMPAFLSSSFDMLRESQEHMVENFSRLPSPMAAMPGFDALQKQQQAFLKSMMTNMPGWPAPAGGASDTPAKEPESREDEIAEIRKQLAALQDRLSKL